MLLKKERVLKFRRQLHLRKTNLIWSIAQKMPEFREIVDSSLHFDKYAPCAVLVNVILTRVGENFSFMCFYCKVR